MSDIKQTPKKTSAKRKARKGQSPLGIWITKEMALKLSAYALKKGKSVSVVVREAIEKAIKKANQAKPV